MANIVKVTDIWDYSKARVSVDADKKVVASLTNYFKQNAEAFKALPENANIIIFDKLTGKNVSEVTIGQ
ncbi:MAG: hypothetical protein WD512_00530 [Candidatus Paceibacterota bacterium]